ncbi:MAG TPA: oligosaccharide flippase family protein [Spirochaetota bacterium]|nr:oligosaccharide flippase family protein [Spirochaetota bacterium]
MFKLPQLSASSKNILKVFTGTSLGQIIGLVSLPLLLKYFSKTDIGLLDLYISLVGTFSVISAFKLELAIVLPKKEKDADGVLALSYLALALFIAVLSVIFFTCGVWFLHLLNALKLKPYLLLIIAGIALKGIKEINCQLLIRHKRFGLFSQSTVIETTVFRITPVLIALLISNSLIYLLLSFLTGAVTANLYIFLRFTKKHRPDFTNSWSMLKKYLKIPFINTASVLLNTFSIHIPVYLVAAKFGAEMVAIYGLANRGINLPMNLISRSFRRVFYQEATELYHKTKDFTALIYKYIKKITLLMLFPLVIVILFAPLAVDLFFGAEFVLSGKIARFMIGYVFLRSITSPLSVSFLIVNRQEIGLVMIIFSIIIRTGAMLYFSASFINMMIALTISAGAFYLIYLLIMIKTVKNSS